MGRPLAAAAFAVFAATAAAAAENRVYEIPRQSLESALIVFSEQSDVMFLAPGAAFEGKVANPVSGAMSPEEALRRLLDGTGLRGEITEGGVPTLIVFAELRSEGSEAMTQGRRTTLLAGVASFLFAGGGAQSASAQDEAVDGVDRIVVTAQYREQDLQETPLAISAFSGPLLEARGAADTNDIDLFVPNAVIQPLGAGWGSAQAAFIRGIGLGDNILSYEPGVPIYVDDVYLGRNQGAILDLLDLERVEVLRGPQGTLFGKNAVGGAVRMISRKPTGEGGDASITVGERNRLNLRGSFDFTIVPDVLMARVSGSSKTQDGYFDILDYECVNGPGSLGGGGDGSSPIFPGLVIDLGTRVTSPNNCVVDHLADENVQSGRGMVLWNATPDIEVLFSADVTHQRQKGPADKYLQINPTAGFLAGIWNNLASVPVFGVPWDDRFLTDSPYTNYNRYEDPITGRRFPNVNDLDEFGASIKVTWNLAPSMELTSITAFRGFENEFGRTSSGSPIPHDLTYDINKHQQWTQEFRLTGTSFDDRLDWTTGAFYYTADSSNYGTGILYPGVLYAQEGIDTQEATNWAAFVHGVFHITDKLSATAGIRYTDDEKNALISRYNFDGTDRLPVPGFTTLTSPVPVDTAETNWSPLVGLDYQINEDFMVFATYSTGFRGGGFSPRPSNALQVTPFQSEELDNYEVGFKSELLDNRLRLNGNAFFSIYADQQLFRTELDPSGALWFHQINTGEAEIWGLEAEFLAEPVDNLLVEGSLGYLHYEVTDPGESGLCVEFQNGDPCYAPRTPENTAAIGVSYELDAGAWGMITPRIDARYQSKMYFTTYSATLGNDIAPNPIEGVEDGYTMVNGRVSWSPQNNDDWEISVYGLNLTDEVYYHGRLALTTAGLGREQGNIGAPREYGVTISRRF
jgi:iron complex outermembrane receptor protein